MLRNGNGDFITFIAAMLMGVAFCLFADIFITLRAVKKCGNIEIFFQDLFCFTVFGFFTFLLLYVRTGGEIRWFAMFGAAGGFLLFYFTINKPLKKAFKRFALFIKKTAMFIKRKIIKPIFSIFSKLCGLISTLTVNLIKKINFLCKKILHKGSDMLYNNKDNKNQLAKERNANGKRKKKKRQKAVGDN